jgi:hypothetical protein
MSAPETDVPLPVSRAHAPLPPIPCAICGRALTDPEGIALVRISVTENRWTCAVHENEAA